MRMLFAFCLLSAVAAWSAGDPHARGNRTIDPDSAAYWPTQQWRTSSPAAEGLDTAPLSAFDGELSAGKHGYVTGMLIIRNGHIVFERSYAHDFAKLFEGKDQRRGPYNYYDPDWHPYYRNTPLHTMQSVTKSVTSALIGIAISRGEITGIDAKMLPFFEAFKIRDDDPHRAAMRLRDVLTMRTGIRWDESSVPYTDPANSCARMEQSDDWIQFVLDQPMAAHPGSRFVYNSGATQLLSHVIRKVSGRQADEYAALHLFKPLGIGRFYWKRTPTGLADTEGGLYLTPADVAKIGYLYLNDGVWEGRRLLPEGWVDASTAPDVETGARGWRYGYQWWVLPRGENRRPQVVAARGYGGQYLLVIPEYQMIVVFTGWNIYDRPALDPQLALERVLQAIIR
jgi:CubicO group peptidase (beta-lactamase class C family)